MTCVTPVARSSRTENLGVRRGKTKINQKPRVLASGVFDLLHLGHVKYLEEAKKAGGLDAELIVIVARDGTVRRRKGKDPVMPENQRRALVESLRVVDAAVLGYEDFSIEKLIERLRPDVIAIGHDQSGMEQSIRDHVARTDREIKIVKISKFSEDALDSSMKIKRKIVAELGK